MDTRTSFEVELENLKGRLEKLGLPRDAWRWFAVVFRDHRQRRPRLLANLDVAHESHARTVLGEQYRLAYEAMELPRPISELAITKKLSRIADEIQKATKGMSEADSIQLACQRNPALWERYARESCPPEIENEGWYVAGTAAMLAFALDHMNNIDVVSAAARAIEEFRLAVDRDGRDRALVQRFMRRKQAEEKKRRSKEATERATKPRGRKPHTLLVRALVRHIERSGKNATVESVSRYLTGEQPLPETVRDAMDDVAFIFPPDESVVLARFYTDNEDEEPNVLFTFGSANESQHRRIAYSRFERMVYEARAES